MHVQLFVSCLVSWKSRITIRRFASRSDTALASCLVVIRLFQLTRHDTNSCTYTMQGRIQGGGGGGAPGARSPKIGKNMIFWRKIVIFYTKYPKIFRASLHSAQFF